MAVDTVIFAFLQARGGCSGRNAAIPDNTACAAVVSSLAVVNTGLAPMTLYESRTFA